MTTLRLNEIKKKIELVGFSMNVDGIRVDYSFEGEDYHLMLIPIQAAKVLDKIGSIDSWYWGEEDLIIVTNDGDKNWKLPWEEFVRYQELSEWEAIEIEARHEESKLKTGVEMFTMDFIDNPNKKIV